MKASHHSLAYRYVVARYSKPRHQIPVPVIAFAVATVLLVYGEKHGFSEALVVPTILALGFGFLLWERIGFAEVIAERDRAPQDPRKQGSA